MYGFDIVRSLLIDVVVEPVGEEEVGMGAPGDNGSESRIVGAIVVAGNVYGKPLGEITAVLVVKSQGRIFGVASDEELTTSACHDDTDARLL